MTYFDDRVRDLVHHAYAHAPSVKRLFDEAGIQPSTIQSADDLAKVPVLSKDSLVDIHQAHPPFGGFLTIDPQDLARIYISPGPIFDPQPPPTDPEAALAAFHYVGFGKGDRVLNTFTYHLTPAGMLLDDGLRACGATVLPTGPGNSDLQITVAMKLGATGFVGQPSYLMTLLDKVEAQGISPADFPIKKALFSAEPYTPSQKQRFEGTWGMKTTSAYGTADLGFIGYTRDGIDGFVMNRTVLLQICDPKTGDLIPDGEIGEIVATTFNEAYPLIRFGTGDLGAISPELIDGKYQHLLGLYGRSGDAIKVRGMFLHPNQLLAVQKTLPEVERLQAIITRPQNRDVVSIQVQLKPGVSPGVIEDRMKELAQNAVRLRIDHVIFVDEIDADARTIVDNRQWN